MPGTIFSSLYNAIDYRLRQLIAWRRAGLSIKNEPKDGLYSKLDASQRMRAVRTAERLVNTYHLREFRDKSGVTNFLENLYYLEMLETALNQAEITLPPELCAADVGTSHWFYVRALYALLGWWNASKCRQVTLHGYENDPYRVYADLHSRYDHAEAHMAHLPGVLFMPEPFKWNPNTYHLATLLFPFVFLADHLRWGLPRRLFNPQQLICDIWSSLKEGAPLIVVDQGEAEAVAMGKLLAQQSIPICAGFRFDSLFFAYDLPRYVTVCLKE